MKTILLLLVLIFTHGCSKPKTVLICGDHVYINKAEAQQFFEDNLSLEVQIIDKKISDEPDLVEINLKSNSNNNRKISVASIKKTKNKIKILSNKEIEKKKVELKKRKEKKENDVKYIKKEKKVKLLKKQDQVKLLKKKENKISNLELTRLKKPVNKTKKEIVDICTIIKKCSIEEISKYLLKKGKEKRFPDITARE